jgi:hypothetical protein
VSALTESGFRFGFAGDEAVRHDQRSGDGNTFWPGVDFRVMEVGRQVWIEVKSWSFGRDTDRTEGKRAAADYADKLEGRSANLFRDEIAAKFLGTTAYLAWSGLGIPERVLYVVLLEPPSRGSRALLGPLRDRLRERFKQAQARPWGRRIAVFVVDGQGYRDQFPGFTLTRE